MSVAISRDQVVSTLCRLAAEQAAVNVAEVTSDTHLFQDLNFDSLDAVEYTLSIEDEYDVNIPDEEAEKVRFVRDAVDLLFAHLEAKQPA